MHQQWDKYHNLLFFSLMMMLHSETSKSERFQHAAKINEKVIQEIHKSMILYINEKSHNLVLFPTQNVNTILTG